MSPNFITQKMNPTAQGKSKSL
jgi:hypothetical protein